MSSHLIKPNIAQDKRTRALNKNILINKPKRKEKKRKGIRVTQDNTSHKLSAKTGQRPPCTHPLQQVIKSSRQAIYSNFIQQKKKKQFIVTLKN